MAQPSISSPSLEQHPTGFGIGSATPRISWRFLLDGDCISGWEQAAYEVEIYRRPDDRTVYHIPSSDSVLVPWLDRPLRSREHVKLRVRVHGCVVEGDKTKDLGPTDWSPWTEAECGLLKRDDWVATPITASEPPISDGPLRPLRFRRSFDAPFSEKISRARLYITGFGVYEAYVNGSRVGDHCMAPGWTSYHHRLNYEVFDVKDLLADGKAHSIAVEVAEGWYATRLGFGGGRRYIYGKDLGVLAQLEITSESGDVITIASDDSWKCRPSAIIRSEIYDGEVYDAREDQPDWTSPGAVETGPVWGDTRALEWPSAELVAPNAPLVRVTQEVKPVEIIKTPSGKTIFDFGQNLAGRVRVKSLLKEAGHSVTLSHAEVLENGELGTRPLRVAKCKDEIISAGSEIRDWVPRFTYHGFRYVQVDGWTPDDETCPLLLSSLVAEVMHTDLKQSGWFSCSHPMVNKLHENAHWSMRGNFLSVPTDCPQRDERMGWTGDIQIFCPSASFLYNTAGMLGDWLKDLSAEQLAGGKGVPPLVVPNVIPEDLWPPFPQAVWDDVTVLAPWELYQSYGDIEILRRQYPSMKAWLDHGVQRGPDQLWDDTLFQLGDWLDPTAPPDQPGNARTDGTLVADAYLVHVTGILSQISNILNNPSDTTRYRNDHEDLKRKFQTKYIAPSGLLVADSQTALSLAIIFNLHPSSNPQQIANAGARLARLVRFSKFKISTGFAGTPAITHALTATGHHQVAYRMLLEKNCPSWMYPISMGATTIWERWNSMLPDGSINPGEMTSFNHYALGSIINWLHGCVGGVSPVEPGWRRIRVAPVPGGTITSAEVAYETPYGRLECRWVVEGGDQFKLEVVVPPNTKALVVLPGEDLERLVGAGRHTFETRYASQADWPPKAIVPPIRTPEDSFV